MQTIKNFNFNNERAIIRVDFNVPLNDNLEVTDKTRIEAAKKLGISPRTLRYKIAKFKESGFEVAL